MSEMYVVLKIITGEQVMAVLKEEDDKYILLDNPMCIKMIPVIDAGKEHVTAHPLCHFADDQSYILSKRDVLFVKKMHRVFVPHYLKIVEEHQQSDFFQPKDNRAEDLQWEDDFTTESAQKAIQQLKEVFGDETEEEEVDWNEKLRNLVPGNDTLN